MKKLLFAVLLSGCATGYHPRDVNGGYYDGHWGNGDRLVSVGFQGNGYTSWEEVEQMGWRRTEEVCRERGYTYFKLIEQVNHIDPSTMGHSAVSIKAICF